MALTSRQLLSQVKEQITEVTPEQVDGDLRSGAVDYLIDVRERDEVLNGYIPGATFVPRGVLETSIEEGVTARRDASIVLYCAVGNRSALAARDLEAMGYTDVASMSSGIRGWKDAGLAVEAGGLLSEESLQRYARHLILPEVGEAGQRRLLEARVLLVGTGGLGCPAALYLTAAGIGALGLVDADVVDQSNLQRQVLFGESDVGLPKVDVARARLHHLNPTIAIEAHRQLLTAANVMDVIADYDIIVNGCDNFPTRYLINDASVLTGKPVVDGSIYRFEGQVTVYDPRTGPCYRCLYPEPPPPDEVPSCAEAGVLGVLPGIIGVVQATEVVKLLLGVGSPLIGRMLVYDALDMTFRELKLRRNPQWPIGGEHPTVKGLIDYNQFCGLPGGHDEAAG